MVGKRIKSIAAAALAVLAVTGYVPVQPISDFIGSTAVTVSAENIKCGDNATWSFESSTGTLTISGFGDMYDYYNEVPWENYCTSITSVVIEDGITSIGNYAFYLTCLRSLYIPGSVRTIGKGAFQNCYYLSSVYFQDGVTTIGEQAFYNCEALSAVIIPKSITSIGGYAFNYCDKLKNIYFIGTNAQWDNIQKGALAYPDECSVESVKDAGDEGNYSWRLTNDDTLIVSGTGEIKNYGSYSDTPWNDHQMYIKSVVIESGITSIGDNAFSRLFYCSSVYIPESVKSIGESAFFNIGYLTSVTIPETVTSISDSAFGYCRELKTVTINNSDISGLSGNIFNGCKKLSVIYFKGDKEELESKIILPEGCRLICGGELGSCGTYANWALDSDGVLTIYGTGPINSYTYENAPWYDQRDEITSVVIENGIIEIGSYAFFECGNIKEVTLPESLEKIDRHAFMYCNDVTDIYCSAPVTIDWEPDAYAFKENKGTVCVVAEKDLSRYKKAFADVNVRFSTESSGSGGGQITVSKCGDNAVWEYDEITHTLTISGNGDMYDYRYGEAPWYSYRSDIAFLSISDDITTIGDNAFVDCTDLSSVSLGSKITTIGENAFAGCTGLKSVTIPENVRKIDYYAFSGCDNIETITCNPNPTTLVWIPDASAFKEDNATLCVVPKANLAAYKRKFAGVNARFCSDFDITLNSSVGGNINSKYSEYSGEIVTLTVTPDAGYEVKSITVNDKLIEAVDGVYSFTMPEKDVTVSAEFAEITQAADGTAVIQGASVTLDGKFELNFFFTLSEGADSSEYTVYAEGPSGNMTLTLDPNVISGYLCAQYPIMSVDTDSPVTVTVRKGEDTIPLYNINNTRIADDCFTYSIYDYAVSALAMDDQYVSAQNKAKIKATYTYGAYAVKWSKGNPLPEDGNINPLPDITYSDLQSHIQRITATSNPYNVKVTDFALVLDSETHFKVRFTCDNINEVMITYKNVNGTKVGELTPVKSGGYYIVEIPNIGAGELMKRYTVNFGEDYVLEFDAMSYVYLVLREEANGRKFEAGLTDMLRALYAYGDAFSGK